MYEFIQWGVRREFSLHAIISEFWHECLKSLTSFCGTGDFIRNRLSERGMFSPSSFLILIC